MTDARSDASNRAHTISGWFGNATDVATSTTGFTAGAARRKVSAAAVGTPREIMRRATGTELHSHPGSAIPAIAAVGTAKSGRCGRARAIHSVGTSTAIPAEIRTPRTRNGRACSTIARNTVDQYCREGTANRTSRKLVR